MPANSDPFAAMWDAIVALAERTGAMPMNKHPGIYSRTLADGYEMHLNAHREPLTTLVDGVDSEVAPYNVWIVRTGYFAGVYANAFEGSLFGMTSLQPIIEALEKTDNGK